MKFCDETQYREGKGVASTDKVTSRRRIITPMRIRSPYPYIERFGKKGVKFIVEGHIQTGSYTNKDGVKVYTSDVVVENMEFAESKGTSAPDDAAFLEVPEEMIAEMPFR